MKKFLFLPMLLLQTVTTIAQIDFSTYKVGDSYLFNDTFKLSVSDVFTTYKSQFSLGENDSIAFRQEQYWDIGNNDRGFMYSSYQQYYKGYKVVGKILSTISKCNIAFIVNGPVISGLDIDVSTPMAEEDALDSALAYLNAPFNVWDDTSVENSFKRLTEDSLATYYPKGELLIIKNDDVDTPSNYKLCWEFHIKSADTLWTASGIDTFITDTVICINANTGAVHFAYNPQMSWFYTYGTAYTPYNGPMNIETKSCSGCFNHRLWDHRNIITSEKVGYENYDIWLDGNNTWDDNFAKSEASGAHWGIEWAYDYFKNTKNYTKLSNTFVITRANLSGGIGAWDTNPNNSNDDMIFVDLQLGGNSCAALDILGHEFTHAIINKHSQLGIGNNDYESHALNEGFSDIFGARIESYTLGWGMDWDYGNNLMPNFKRSFYHPYLDVPYTSATTYGGSHFTDGKYAASGPLRVWFAHVSSGNWDWGSLPPLGMSIAENFSWVLMAYALNPHSNYQHAYNQSMNIANATWGACTPQWKAVERAWYDVGIGTLSSCKKFNIDVPDVVVQVDLGEPEIAPRPEAGSGKIMIKSNAIPAEAAPTGMRYTWQIPYSWYGHFNLDSSVYYIDSLADLNSQFVSVDVSYNYEGDSYEETLTTVVHFTTECSTEPQQAAGKLYSGHTVSPIINVGLTEPNISIYPNPTSEYINVQLYDVASGTITMSSVSGQVIFATQVSEGLNRLNLPSEIAPGIYLLTLKGEKVNIVKRIIIR